MTKTTVYLPPELKRALTRLARQRQCSEAELVREAVSRLAVKLTRPSQSSLCSDQWDRRLPRTSIVRWKASAFGDLEANTISFDFVSARRSRNSCALRALGLKAHVARLSCTRVAPDGATPRESSLSGTGTFALDWRDASFFVLANRHENGWGSSARTSSHFRARQVTIAQRLSV